MSNSSSEEIRWNVVSWLADRIDDVRQRRAARGARQTAHRSKRQGLVGKAKQKIHQKVETFKLGTGPQPIRYQRVNRYAANRQAQTIQEKAIASAASLTEFKSPRDLARELCVLLEAQAAEPLVMAWFDNSALDEGDAVVDMGNLGWVIGVAAAVVVAVVVVLVRLGRSVHAPHVSESPSRDFDLIREVAEEDGPGAAAAQMLKEQATEPWRWDLVDGVSCLEEAARRALLLRLAEQIDSGVETVEPNAGGRFDPQTMSTVDDLSQDDIWVVTEMFEPGFTLRSRTLAPARVGVATLDSCVLLDDSCPVGRLLKERADELIPGGSDSAATWRATWGLSHPEDLRNLLDEAVLDGWRKRMIAELNDGYPGEKARQLVLTGEKGGLFERSAMDVEGDPPAGDAIVEALVDRDGVPQHGLACPEGSPLLLAVVRTRTSEVS